MLTGLHPVVNYTQERYSFIRRLEGYGLPPNRQYAYVDPIGIPTIGVGFNLGVGVRMTQVLSAFGFDIGGRSLDGQGHSDAAAAERRYINRIYGAIWNNYRRGTQAQATARLQAELERIMSDRFNDVNGDYAGTNFVRRQHFGFEGANNGEDEARNLFNNVVVGEFEGAVTRRIVDAQGNILTISPERIALVSLAYTGPGLLGLRRPLVAAISGDHDNRAEAWYEIRYGSNRGGGHTNRRYAEAALFNLYDYGHVDGRPETITDPNEAKEVMRMYTRHQLEAGQQGLMTMTDYETRRGRPATAGGLTIRDIDTEVGDAKSYLITNFVTNVLTNVAPDLRIDGLVMVGRGLASYEYIDQGGYNDELSGSIQRDENDLMFGERGNDLLTGWGGQDVIYGGEGDDHIYGGRGNDFLYGGADNDTYYINTGDGTDRIEDNQGTNNRVIFNGRPILTFIEQRHGMEYRYVSTDGFFGGDYQGSDFVVTEIASGTQVILNEDFQEGDFGIKFYDELTPPENPVTTNEWPGDQYPEHPNDIFYGTTDNELILCGAGEDWVCVWGDENWIKGGDGDDLIEGCLSTSSIIEGGEGSDVLWGSNQIFADSYGDMETLIEAGETAESTNEKGDLIRSRYSGGDSFLYGSNGNDIVLAGAGKDLIVGAGGDDLIISDGDFSFAVTRHTVHDWSYTIEYDQNANTYTPIMSGVIWWYSEEDDEGDRDVIYAGTGNDYVDSRGGDDEVHAGTGDDIVFVVRRGEGVKSTLDSHRNSEDTILN